MSQDKSTATDKFLNALVSVIDFIGNLLNRFRAFLADEFWSVMLFACLALGICGVFLHNETGDPRKFDWEILGNGLMLSGACFFAGGLCGFLFGIPRTVQAGAGQTSEEVDYRINTNLEQISDWLTKIIVGLTLVNLHEIPKFFEKLANDMKSGMGGQDSDVVFAGGIMVYFLILGFLAGYITTRTQISSLFSRADATLLFSRRDTDLLRTIAEMFESGRPMLDDDVRKLEAQISSASLLTQNSIFAYTKNCRKIFHKRKEAAKIGKTVIVFNALVEADYEGLNHPFRGQLGYAYKDRHLDKKKPWDEGIEKAMIPDFEKAVEIFESAIQIRGDWKSKGYGVYELNLAITKLELLRLKAKYAPNPSMTEMEIGQEKEAIKRHFMVAWQSGDSYQETIKREYKSWYNEGKVGEEIKVGEIFES
ncbi:MAG: hypothetical protein ACKVUS_15785 [Saprospiraceae bacterium]